MARGVKRGTSERRIGREQEAVERATKKRKKRRKQERKEGKREGKEGFSGEQ